MNWAKKLYLIQLTHLTSLTNYQLFNHVFDKFFQEVFNNQVVAQNTF